MNWGYKILVVYIVFIGMILGMVYVASQQTNEMQDENYYEKELKYQEVIDGKNNLQALNDTLFITNTADAVVLKIPVSASTAITEGTVYFMKPSDQSKDLRLALSVDATGIQSISRTKFVSGRYTVQISWKSNGKTYYSEQPFNVK